MSRPIISVFIALHTSCSVECEKTFHCDFVTISIPVRAYSVSSRLMSLFFQGLGAERTAGSAKEAPKGTLP